MIWRERDFFSMVVDRAAFHFMLPWVKDFYQALSAQSSDGIGMSITKFGRSASGHVAVFRRHCVYI